MATWSIDEIQAVPDIPCISSTGRLISPTNWLVWTPGEDYIDGDTGSYVPVTFRTPPGGSLDYRVPIGVAGTYPFPESWRGKRYLLCGWVNATQVLLSQEIDVPESPSETVIAAHLFLLLPSPATSVLPFRWAGDFLWTISLGGESEKIPATGPTRLELCWSRSNPPDGPADPPPGVDTRVDLTPGYPIGLFRMFSPCPTEFQNPPQDPLAWYIDRAMRSIWNPASTNPQYDTMNGNPHYNVGMLGGSFNLDSWIRVVAENCNCYDLAAIAQLACAILVDEDGNELIGSNWVFQCPNGYINPGPLFGWVPWGGDHLRCNSPFWQSQGTGPFVDPDSDTRTKFGNHAWVEVTLAGSRGVLDTTHALEDPSPSPETGTHTRLNYLQLTLDPNRSNIDASTRVGDQGACWINPWTQTERIGVINAAGQLNHPRLDMLRQSMKDDLESVLERGRSTPQLEPTFNTAPVDPETLISMLFPRSNFVHDHTAISVKKNMTEVIIKVILNSEQNIKKILLRLAVFDSFEDPISALTFHLLGFQRAPLRSFIETCDVPLGAFSFRTSNSVFWVRGNLFIRIDEFDTAGTSTSSALCYGIATTFDEYLATQTNPEDQGRPSIELDKSTIPHPILRGQRFKVKLERNDTLLGITQSGSDNVQVILPGGPGNDMGEFEFYANGTGKGKIYIHTADKVTMRPASVATEVEVQPSEIADPWAGWGIA